MIEIMLIDYIVTILFCFYQIICQVIKAKYKDLANINESTLLFRNEKDTVGGIEMDWGIDNEVERRAGDLEIDGGRRKGEEELLKVNNSSTLL